MGTTITHTSGKSTSALATLAVLTLFFVLSLSLILNELPYEWAIPPWIRSLSGISLIGAIVFFPICLCIGWIKGFPRWSYPYAGQVLLFSLYLTNASTPGLLFGRELWGWRAWIPLLIVTVVSFWVTRSLYSLPKIFINIKNDWTLLTFGMFGFMPLIISAIFDEMDRLYSLYFMVILTFLMAGTVIAYMQNPTQRGRINALLIGIFLTITIAVLGPAWFWFYQMKANPWPTVIAGIIFYLIMFSPALIGIFHKPVQTA